MNFLKVLPFALLITIASAAFSQGTAINSTGAGPDASAGLDVDFSNRGMLAPRLTDAQRNAIVNPAEGLFIFNLTSGCFNYYHGGAWFQWCGNCIPPASPVAGSNSPVCSGNAVNLTASSVPGASYTWTGPNGFTSTAQNPTISNAQTAASGVYSVSVVLGGCPSAPSTVNVTVNQTPVSSFSASPSQGSVNQDVTFTPTVTGAVYLWKFQSGTPATSTVQNPLVQWSSTGTFNVSLVVTANGCTSDTTHSTITISTCAHSSQTFSYTGSIVTWTVPSNICSPATIEVKGGEGGKNYFNDRITGKGAIIKGDFVLTGGQQLRIIVGQQGLTGVSNPYGAGSGGGASVVSVVGSSTPLIVAGGGGGCGGRQSTYYDGGPAQTGNNGGSAYPSGPSVGGIGGTGGNGGIGHSHCGAAGGGWYTAGGNTISDATCGSPLNGTAAGGIGGSYGNTGGFGGGGGSNIAGGGGGGYSGGAGGDQTSGWNEWGGGGGGSFNTGTNQSNTVGNTGNGVVTITW
jgi:hypothetical protein